MTSTKRVQISFLACAITAVAPFTGRAAQPSVPATGKIVYESCYADLVSWQVLCDIRIWMEGADTLFASLGQLPKWSPDGKKISYIAYGYDYYGDYWSGQVLVADAEPPGDYRIVMPDYSSVYGVEWVSNTRLVFGSDRTGYPELYALNDDGTGLVQLTNGIGFTGSFAVAPGGGAIAVVLDVAGARDVFRINPDGSGLRSLTSNSGYQGGRTSWSPDATRLIFDCNSEVCSVNADGGGLTQLTSGGGGGGTLSQAGKLAFAKWFNTGQEPVVEEVDGRIVRIANGTSGHTPIWSQNGGTVIFQGNQPVTYSGRCYFTVGHNADDFCVPLTGIYMVNADATGLRMVATGSNPDWQMTMPGEPNASFMGQCDGVNCGFDATASSDPDGGILTYSWKFGDGTAGSGVTPSHTYATGATYTVTLTVSDANGLTDTIWRTFTANTPPVAAFKYSCNAATCTFNGTHSTDVDGTVTSYDWSFGDGVSGYGATVSHLFPTGTFIVRLVAYDSGGASGMTTASVAVVNPVPAAAFTSSCSGFTCSFNSSGSTDDGPLRFSWIYGDGVIDNNSNANPSHRYYAPGTYQVTLTVTDMVGQTATFTNTVNVNPERMHVGDLDGSRSQPSRSWWYPTVTVTVHGADHRRLLNVLVSGRWSNGQIASCWTDSAGQCFVTGPYVRGNDAPSFTVDNLSHEALAYSASANHDVDGDSNGTTLNVFR